MNTNVNPVITAAQSTAVNQAIATINTNLIGMVNLSNDEKLHASKMGADTYDYCVKAVLMMTQNPTVTPSWVSPATTQSNMDTFNSLRAMHTNLVVLQQKIEDTMTQMGIQIKKSADDFYDNAKAASDRGSIAGANGIVNELREFYAKSEAEQKIVEEQRS